jgi:nucleotide-binding universal stress UspA family protein
MYQRILVPLDGSPTSLRGLGEAIKLAKNQQGLLRLLAIAEEPVLDYGYEMGTCGALFSESVREYGNNILKIARDRVQADDLVAESLLLEFKGEPVAAMIVAQAQEWAADLIVMGTHGRRGLSRLALGSVAENVVRLSAVPVLLLRAESPPA